MDTKIRDIFGRDIVPGCYIIYGTLLGRSAAIKVGKVLKAYRIEKSEYAAASDSDCRITVTSAEKSNWNGKWSATNKGTLLFPNRCVVTPESDIPKEVLELLND